MDEKQNEEVMMRLGQSMSATADSVVIREIRKPYTKGRALEVAEFMSEQDIKTKELKERSDNADLALALMVGMGDHYRSHIINAVIQLLEPVSKGQK